jgi:uncharacterized membrane-anchored protein
MNNRPRFLFLFGLLALVQLYVPASMILDREAVLATGKEYKFQLAPVDPNDPFRGKYITLHYTHNTFDIPDAQAWKSGELIYVELYRDPAGFARIRQVSKEKPRGPVDYIKTRVTYVATEAHNNTLFIDYPFDRYYLEESKALPAEQAYAASLRDSSQVTYALVRIKAGKAVLEEVLIGGIPIREKVKAGRRQP